MQERMEKPSEQKAVGFQAPNVEGSLHAARQAANRILVIHGANSQYFDNLVGKTVGSIKKSLRDVFNLAGDSPAQVGNKEVGDDYVMIGGQTLEFGKEAGVKGAHH